MRRAFLDLETTGVDPYDDRIVEIAIEVEPDPFEGGTMRHYFVERVDPGRPIPPDATAVHGITDSDVEGALRFREIAPRVQELLSGSVLVTYNGMRFDTILVDRELRDAGEKGLDRDDRGRIVHPEIDLLALWRNVEPRDLRTAVRRFAGAKGFDAHSASGDISVLGDVLAGMTSEFLDVIDDEDIVALSRPAWMVDRDGKFRRRDDGRIVLAFGKHRDELASSVPDYLSWMLGADFSPETKSWATDLLSGSEL